MNLFRTLPVVCLGLALLVGLQAHLPAATPGTAPTVATMTVEGTLANVDGGNLKISIRAKDKTRAFLMIGHETMITRGGKTVTLDTLHAGDTVTATFVTNASGDQLAVTITAAAAKPKMGGKKRR